MTWLNWSRTLCASKFNEWFLSLLWPVSENRAEVKAVVADYPTTITNSVSFRSTDVGKKPELDHGAGQRAVRDHNKHSQPRPSVGLLCDLLSGILDTCPRRAENKGSDRHCKALEVGST